MKKSLSEKASRVTKEYVLELFVDLMDSDEEWKVKVKGLELLGKYLEMFNEKKDVNFNIRSLVAEASLEDLQRIAGEGNEQHYLGAHKVDEE